MNKEKIKNANNLRSCAAVIMMVGVVASVVTMFLNVGPDPTWGFVIGIINGLPMLLASIVSYFFLIVLADISDSLAGGNEENKEEPKQ